MAPPSDRAIKYVMHGQWSRRSGVFHSIIFVRNIKSRSPCCVVMIDTRVGIFWMSTRGISIKVVLHLYDMHMPRRNLMGKGSRECKQRKCLRDIHQYIEFDDFAFGDYCGEGKLVGAIGFEPTTPSPPAKCATRLRYAPTRGFIMAMSSSCNV